ncbi:Hypothetical protein PHPALM_3067 [Phytophthora palmivora]|uniref:Uncharacterized protein n=1 Tax=Phytophthora palmivora TaxID=4796 RepID=A0A2P4YNF2_9STRA|nr:Hypothetical protein PHPALM_3067 [Phytophthora palmivora]
MKFRYTIVHIGRTNNRWVGIISRLGGRPPVALTTATAAYIKRVTRSQFLLAIAHCGAQGHRGKPVILNHMRHLFRIMDSQILCAESFVSACYRFDTCKYLLAFKDNFTRICELLPCDTLTGEVVVEALLGWYSRFGVSLVWVSDKGSHV